MAILNLIKLRMKRVSCSPSWRQTSIAKHVLELLKFLLPISWVPEIMLGEVFPSPRFCCNAANLGSPSCLANIPPTELHHPQCQIGLLFGLVVSICIRTTFSVFQKIFWCMLLLEDFSRISSFKLLSLKIFWNPMFWELCHCPYLPGVEITVVCLRTRNKTFQFLDFS